MTVTPIAPGMRSTPHLHEPFLERASGGGDQRGHALGAFLTLRLIDRIAEAPGAAKSESLAYQVRACATYLGELVPTTEEVSHLREIVHVARSVQETGNKRLLWAPLQAFAYWLEQELRLEESIDALDSALRLENASAIHEKIATQLQRGGVLRLAGKFDESQAAYTVAGQLANLAGDWHSVMVSRIGHAKILQKTGDLPRAEQVLREVLGTAVERGDAPIEARASHDLSVNMHLMSRRNEAVPLALRAYELYDEPMLRARAVNDLGTFLKELGHYAAARDAFLLVLRTQPTPEFRMHTAIELLELAALVQDRVGFSRWRRELNGIESVLPPSEHVDLKLKLGAGVASFGNHDEGIAHLEHAIVLAEEHKLAQKLFEAERVLREVHAGKAQENLPARNVVPDATPEVQGVIDRLSALRGAS